MTRPFATLASLVTAILLSALFWPTLWLGGGFIGGDTYTYYLPQKVWYADRLQAGEFPLWHSLTGHGYPLVAESQTGVFYPLNLLLYRMCDVNVAYGVNHLVHYVGTFLVSFALAARLRLSVPSSLFAALTFTYGWFPTRVCLEWAIIGGFWFVWLLWCAESYLQDGTRRWLLLLSLGLGLDLLAGHFNLAFIALLTLTAYVPARLFCASGWLADEIRTARARSCGWLLASVGLGFALAAVQVWPTWELKQLSQREQVGLTFDPGYGHIPPLYLSQVILPWVWYAPDVDTEKAVQSLKAFAINSATNKVEAHLYFGLMPWALVLSSFVLRRVMSEKTSPSAEAGNEAAHRQRLCVIWLVLSLMAVVLATGWTLPVTKHLPGFGFFAGPGRYGIVATLGMALLAGMSLDQMISFLRKSWQRRLTLLTLFVFAIGDLWLVSALVTNAFALDDPPINRRSASAVARVLKDFPQPPRMLAPGPNLPTLTGFAATPQYLGLGPREYFDPQLQMPVIDDPNNEAAIAAQVAWLRRAGVTHLLHFEPLKNPAWPVRPVWQGYDPLLHPAWARSPDEPLYLYELLETRGRAAFINQKPGESVRITDYRANQVTLSATTLHGAELVLTDLIYPGWTVTVNGQSAQPIRVDGMFRGVYVPPGEHTIVWQFRPTSLGLGLGVSIVAIIVWWSLLLKSGIKNGWLKSEK